MSHAQAAFDPADPHGFHAGEEHGHHIVSARMLTTILLVLLALTGLTVAAAQVETYIQHEMGIHIPVWINVVVAMSIAVVKGALVCLFFMQLRYDTPINGAIFLFCLLTLFLFFLFPLIDISSRGEVDSAKRGEIVAGGIGGKHGKVLPDGTKTTLPDNTPLYLFVKQAYYENLLKEGKIHNEAEFQAYVEEHYLHGHGHAESNLSTANASRPRFGITPGLFDATDPAAHGAGHSAAHGADDHSGPADGHADEHAEDHADEHAESEHPAPAPH
ncbi:MAG: cytochrome C oxidase subunit IV family protein [Phycisphaerales bacterium]|jgi:caa(3)-type oxidase subunit IV|nr:cytochrome C oxidase subunit IV family protein [Phycisphaerales bacterium]